jgi:hypoxanthine-guanine phosphoribosyltransferase
VATECQGGWCSLTGWQVREGNRRIVKVKEGEVKGYHVFIVDDLVKTGLLFC